MSPEDHSMIKHFQIARKYIRKIKYNIYVNDSMSMMKDGK